MEIVENISMKDVRESGAEKIYYAANTCWWTHDPAHLGVLEGSGLPCDPRGSLLLETDDVQGFLNAAATNPEYYGRHGLRAFMAAHHQNCQLSLTNPRPWSEPMWDEYNDALDRLDERKKTTET